MTSNPKSEFFDKLADGWDEMVEPERVLPVLRQGLQRMEVGPGERILDLGCGTGILLGLLLERLGPRGRVEAVDISPRMIERARAKRPDPRVCFHLADAARIPLADRCLDRVICFSAWPHFTRPGEVIAEMRRLLRPGGPAHVWHADSRQTINQIHHGAGEQVRDDLLEEARLLAARFVSAGFLVTEVVDNERAYLVTALSPSPSPAAGEGDRKRATEP